MSGEIVARETAIQEYSAENIQLIKDTVAKGCTDAELKLFLYTAGSLGLNPLTKQIHAIKRWDAKAGKEVMSIQIGIDGFRSIAEETGEYAGQLGPFWCGTDGEWHDVWLKDEPPVAAKVGVLRKGWTEPLWGVARYASYCQRNKEGQPVSLWKTMPDVQTAKCAEALGIRKAFPKKLSGVYAREEMAQAANEEQDVIDGEVTHTPKPNGDGNRSDTGDPATAKQVKMAHALAAQKFGHTDAGAAVFGELKQSIFGRAVKTTDLTKKECSALIERLQALEDHVDLAQSTMDMESDDPGAVPEGEDLALTGEDTSKPLACEACARMVEGTTWGGQLHTAESLAEYSREKYNRVLCGHCLADAAAAARKEAARK